MFLSHSKTRRGHDFPLYFPHFLHHYKQYSVLWVLAVDVSCYVFLVYCSKIPYSVMIPVGFKVYLFISFLLFHPSGCIDVDRSPFIYDEIKRAQENLVLANDLHLLYLVTTPDMTENIQPSWMTYLKQVKCFENAVMAVNKRLTVVQ